MATQVYTIAAFGCCFGHMQWRRFRRMGKTRPLDNWSGGINLIKLTINLINLSLSADYVGVERYSSLLNVIRNTVLRQRKRRIININAVKFGTNYPFRFEAFHL